MIDIRYVREHSNEVRKNLRKRKNPALLKRLDSLLKIDDVGDVYWRGRRRGADCIG